MTSSKKPKLKNPSQVGSAGAVLTPWEQREIDALQRMFPHERLWTVRHEGYEYLDPCPEVATYFTHNVTWSCKFHSDPECRKPMEAGGVMTFMSPVRHDPTMINVGLLCPSCGEPIDDLEDLKVYIEILPIDREDTPDLILPNAPGPAH